MRAKPGYISQPGDDPLLELPGGDAGEVPALVLTLLLGLRPGHRRISLNAHSKLRPQETVPDQRGGRGRRRRGSGGRRGGRISGGSDGGPHEDEARVAGVGQDLAGVVQSLCQ